MSEITESKILDALRRVNDPEIHRSIIDLNMVRDLKIKDGKVSFTLALTIPECPLRDQLAQDARLAVKALPDVKEVEVTLGAMNAEERQEVLQPKAQKPAMAVKNQIQRVIAVMSGKGGVGKSLVTGLLATSLMRAGHRVGILDADVTGPSIPKLFGVHGPLNVGKEGIEPIQSRLGIKIVSINLALENEEQAVIWRGPMITNAIQQFWKDVNWGQLDELLVDLPPGTSDAALTVMQSLPINGILIVTTPQSLATMVVNKTVTMAHTLKVPIIGIIENMSGYIAEDTGKHYEIFGPSHSAEVSQLSGASVLARLPISSHLTIQCDAGLAETLEVPEINAVVKDLVKSLN